MPSNLIVERPKELSTIQQLMCTRFAKSIGGTFEVKYYPDGSLKTAVVVTADKIGFVQQHKDRLYCLWKDGSGYQTINHIVLDMVFDEYKILPDNMTSMKKSLNGIKALITDIHGSF